MNVNTHTHTHRHTHSLTAVVHSYRVNQHPQRSSMKPLENAGVESSTTSKRNAHEMPAATLKAKNTYSHFIVEYSHKTKTRDSG